MALKTRKFDVAKFLETDQDIALTLSETLETGDAATVAHAFGAVAWSRGMAKVARLSRLGRESLTKTLSGSVNLELATVLRVAKALGLELAAKPMASTDTDEVSKAEKGEAHYGIPRPVVRHVSVVL